MFFSGNRDDGSRPNPAESMLRRFREFPGPIALAVELAAGSAESAGGEHVDGFPFSVHVTYHTPAGATLLVRTKAVPRPEPETDGPRPPQTIDTLENAFGIYALHAGRSGAPSRGASPDERAAWRAERLAAHRRDKAAFEALERRDVSVLIDGVPFEGFRVDCPEYSVVELDWNGQTVQCVAKAEILDVLALRSAGDADAQRITSFRPGLPRR